MGTQVDPRRLGVATGAVVMAYALFLGAVRAGLVPIPGSSHGDVGPSHADLGALWLTAQLALPGVIAIIGALRRSGPMLIAAGALCMGQSVIAFSGVTLPFLVPAIALIVLGGRTAKVPGRRRESIAAAVIVALAVSAFIVGFTMTETSCWTATRAADGTLVYADVPERSADPETGVGGVTLDEITVASGCGGGALTPAGAALALLLDALAVAVALWGTSRPAALRPPPSSGDPATPRYPHSLRSSSSRRAPRISSSIRSFGRPAARFISMRSVSEAIHTG
jgi:hypothetical protein